MCAPAAGQPSHTLSLGPGEVVGDQRLRHGVSPVTVSLFLLPCVLLPGGCYRMFTDFGTQKQSRRARERPPLGQHTVKWAVSLWRGPQPLRHRGGRTGNARPREKPGSPQVLVFGCDRSLGPSGGLRVRDTQCLPFITWKGSTGGGGPTFRSPVRHFLCPRLRSPCTCGAGRLA